MDTIGKEEFLAKYAFSEDKRGLFGVEIEYFLASLAKVFEPVPDSEKFLVGMPKVWGYELSACQVEYHTEPAKTSGEIVEDLQKGWGGGVSRASKIGRGLVACELAPENMTLAIYGASARYKALAKRLPEETLRAACRVAGVHIHIGMGSLPEALYRHNLLALNLERLLAMGDHSRGERVRLYKVMAPNFQPPIYQSADHLYETGVEQGFVEDPRDCYHFVRFNPVGTVEVRAFGTTGNFDEIADWIDVIIGILR